MKNKSALDHFYNAVSMGEIIFLDYMNRTMNTELKTLIGEIISSFKSQKEIIYKAIKKENPSFDDSLSFPQKNAILLEKIRTRMISDDFSLCLEMIKCINSAIIGSLKYLNKHKERFNVESLKIVKESMKYYDNDINLVISYSLNKQI